ncbi:PAS domain S-box protein [Synechococcus sp. GreenBA-s]|nr:PAS domain S-box protein [Synechococcus sp. GreenBA-s]
MDHSSCPATGSAPGDPATEGLLAGEDLGQGRLFEQAMRHAAIGMALVTAEGRFLEVNAALCQMLGRDEATLRQLQLRDVTHPEDLAESFQLVEEMVAGRREAFQREKRYIHADGHLIWGQVSVSCLRSGGQCLFIVQILDVSEARRQRLALAEQEEHYRLLAENALAITEAIPVGTYTMVLPPQGGMASFAFMSERFLQICGLEREEAAADPLRVFACVHPDDHDAWVQRNAEAFANKQPFVGECRVVVDGEVRWIRAESTPRDLPDGSTVWEGVLIDISDQHRATEQLAASEQHFRLLAENSSDVVFRIDREGRIVWVSPSLTAALGWLPEDWIGQVGTQFLLHGGEAEQYQANLDRLKMDGTSVIARDQIYAKDGRLHWIETHAGPCVNGEGVVDGNVASFHIIDEMVAAEEKLKQSERRHRRLSDQMLDVVWAINLEEGKFTYFSPSLQRVRGFTPEELIAMPLEQQFTPASYAVVLEGVRQAREDVAAGRPVIFQQEVEEYCKDGSTVWTDVKATSIYDEDGQFLEVAGVSRDITVQRKLQEQLRISEERHRRLADQMLDVVWAISLDGQLTYLSPSVQQLRGFSPEEIMDLPLNQTLTPDSYALVAEGLSKARDDVAAGRPVVFHAELEEYCKDGSTVWTDAKATSIYAKEGNFLEIVGITRDITIQRRLREELRISEERYRLLAENARDVIWTMERDGRISYVSPSIQLLRGYTPEEAMHQPLEQTLTPDSQQRSRAYFQQMLEDLQAGRVPQPFRGGLEYYCHDGSTIWADVIALPTFKAEGEFDKLLGVSRDISERKAFERQLIAANQQLQELATTDTLTGIWNRRQMEATIDEAIDRSDRYGEPLTLILCDIDHFKTINDHLGHPVGDQVLIEFCRRIREQLRTSDGFGRWGGEEFLILLPQSEPDAALALAEKLRQLIAATPFSQAGTVTASFGVAQRREGESLTDWLQRLDGRLYASKEAGRNCVAGD